MKHEKHEWNKVVDLDLRKVDFEATGYEGYVLIIYVEDDHKNKYAAFDLFIPIPCETKVLHAKLMNLIKGLS